MSQGAVGEEAWAATASGVATSRLASRPLALHWIWCHCLRWPVQLPPGWRESEGRAWFELW